MKKPYLSKTLWLNFLAAAFALFYPSANDFLGAHPDLVIGGVTVLNMVLRFATKDKISLE